MIKNNIKFNLKHRCFIIIFLLSIFITSTFCQIKVYYVSSEGTDNNNGLNIKKPLRNINTAIKLCKEGDTIYILPGVYKEKVLIKNINGNPEKPIYISGILNNENEYPIIDGGCNIPLMDVLYHWIVIEKSSWIELNKLRFRNGWTDPIKLNNSSYISFRKCDFFGGRRVIDATGENTHHILVENCYWDQGGEDLWRIEKDSMGHEAWLSMHHEIMKYYNGSLIDLHGTGGSIVIRKNKIRNAFNAIRWRGIKGFDSNIEIYDNDVSQVRDNDFEPEYYTYNLHIYHNVSHNIHRTLSIDNVEGGNVYYYGNIITTDTTDWAKKICTSFWKVYGTQRNVTYPIYGFNNSFFGVCKAFTNLNQTTKLFKHFNNAYHFLSDSGWVMNFWEPTNEFNFDISNKEWPPNITNHAQEKNGRIIDIKYKDPFNRDLKLLPGSPGIDAGKVMHLPEFDWVQTYEGIKPDIGVFENNKLIEGPPFRFQIPPDSKVEYKEKPRIVKYKTEKNKLILYFSSKIDPRSLQKECITVFQNEKAITTHSITLHQSKYMLVIETNDILSEEFLSIKFNKIPSGINGEQVTSWASVIKIIK